MAPRLSGQTSIFGVVFFISKSLLGIERQKKLKTFTILARKPRSMIHGTCPIYHTKKLFILAQKRMRYLIFRFACVIAFDQRVARLCVAFVYHEDATSLPSLDEKVDVLIS